MRRWPPLIWPLVSLASLFILMGLSGGWNWVELAIGVVLALTAFGLAMYVATKGLGERPDHPALWWSMGGLAIFYVLIAIAASTAGPEYAIAGLAAGIIPLTALAIMVATIRAKTAEGGDGELVDTSAGADDDASPGIGLDDQTPLGDTPEHSDAPREHFRSVRR